MTVLEHASLQVRPGLEDDFVDAFDETRPLIEATPGFVGMRLMRCVERSSAFLLLVEWERLEDHEIGFRQSVRYPEWSRLLHPFYDPFPTVQHFIEL